MSPLPFLTFRLRLLKSESITKPESDSTDRSLTCKPRTCTLPDVVRISTRPFHARGMRMVTCSQRALSGKGESAAADCSSVSVSPFWASETAFISWSSPDAMTWISCVSSA